jgi:hypothetical protein
MAHARLEHVVAGSELMFPVRRLAADGVEAWQQVVERGYEGYRQGRSEPVRGGADAAVVEGETEGLDRPGRSVAAAH